MRVPGPSSDEPLEPPPAPAPGSDTLYAEPAFYRQLFKERSHDLPFYLGLAARAGGPLLELGAGTGRVTLVLARAGYTVTGVDRSAPMLDDLRAALEREPAEVRARIELRVADAGALALGRSFALVLMPFNAMAHFHSPAELDSLFSVVREHLAPGGSFAFDLLEPDPARLAGSSSTVPWFRHPRTGEVCRCDEEVRYDSGQRIVTIETTVRWMEVERPPERLTLRLRQFQPHEVERILVRRGFELVDRDRSLVDATGYVCVPRG